jgi:hypothetical protein
MKIKCEGCFTLSICLSQVHFQPQPEFSFGYIFGWGNCTKRCDYLNKLSFAFNSPEFESVKHFFLKEKGIL